MNSSLSAPLSDTLQEAEEVTQLPLRRRTRPLPSPAELRAQLPLSPRLTAQIRRQRQTIRALLNGDDPRLLVVVGPCSLHDSESALDYAQRLADLSAELNDQLLLVIRAYVEKPRTTVGWKGLAYDPSLDGSSDLAAGLELSRSLMLQMVELGLPVAGELLQPLVTSYLDDLLGWAAIGARTSESQIHREMVSGLDMAVGFKNGTDGSMNIAVDAMRSAAHPHQHFGVDLHGRPSVIETQGNGDTHLVLRGGRTGPNYDATSIAEACAALEQANLNTAVMVDCSHANSGKDPLQQPAVFHEVVSQRLAGNTNLRAVMLESHLFDGCQPLSPELRYGVSITDGCLGWGATEQLLREVAQRLHEA